MNTCDMILTNATILGRNGKATSDQAVIISQGLIEWCGSQQELPQTYLQNPKLIENCHGQLITPGLIDCHTHLVFAGNRAHEFKLKLEGMSYAEIAKAGGGILSTVHHTRLASEEQLLQESLLRLLTLREEGVTTVEIKSGYGLDMPNELKMLRVARKLGELTGMRVKTTFLGAHAVPQEYKGNTQGYVDFLCHSLLPSVHHEGLADAVDVFCETIGFSLAQTEQLFETAYALNLPIKCHAEQLSNLGASVLASQFKALSCDHLEFLDEQGALAMAESGTTAVLLPGAFYFLREQHKPPVELLRQAGVSIAVATDCNPGSSPTASLRLMMSMACQFFSLSVPEVLAGVTIHAAKALGIENEVGAITPGAAADLVLWSLQEPEALCYYFAYPLPHRTMINGTWIN